MKSNKTNTKGKKIIVGVVVVLALVVVAAGIFIFQKTTAPTRAERITKYQAYNKTLQEVSAKTLAAHLPANASISKNADYTCDPAGDFMDGKGPRTTSCSITYTVTMPTAGISETLPSLNWEPQPDKITYDLNSKYAQNNIDKNSGLYNETLAGTSGKSFISAPFCYITIPSGSTAAATGQFDARCVWLYYEYFPELINQK